MSNMHTSDGRHRTEVRAEWGGTRQRPTVYVPLCDCGWSGEPTDRSRDADEDADEHVRLMAGE